MVFQDVTEARALSQKLAYLAHHDSLTDLPNRVLFQDRVHQACQFGRCGIGAASRSSSWTWTTSSTSTIRWAMRSATNC